MEAGQTVDGYVFEKLLGRGGMAEVWSAREVDRTELLALKILLPEFRNNDAIRQRFEREGKLVLPHRNIVPVLATTEIDGRPTLVMPLYGGGSLESLIRPGNSEQESGTGKPLALAKVFSISQNILAALNFAHQHGTIHRDVKPANILLDEYGTAYLSDFGTATEMRRILVTRYAGGTPLWTSPEQIKSPKNVRHSADVYSFGCCLYDMLSGRPPFDADVEDDVAWAWAVQTKQVTETPDPPSKWNPAIPPALDEIVLKALAKKPDERIAGCGEFSRLLGEIEGELVGRRQQERKHEQQARRKEQPEPVPPVGLFQRTDIRLAAAALAGFLVYLILLWSLTSETKLFKKTEPNSAVSILPPAPMAEGSHSESAAEQAVRNTDLPTSSIVTTPTEPKLVAVPKARKNVSVASVPPGTPNKVGLDAGEYRGQGVASGYHSVGDSGPSPVMGEVDLIFRDEQNSPIEMVTVECNGKSKVISGATATLTVPYGRVHVKASKPGYDPANIWVDINGPSLVREIRMAKSAS